MHPHGVGLELALGGAALTAEFGIIGGEQHLVLPGLGDAHGIPLPQNRGEVAHHHDPLALLVPADEGGHVVLVVVSAQPLEALPGEVLLPEGGGLEVEVVQRLEVGVELAVGQAVGGGGVDEVPVQRGLEVPLVPLAELATHHGQLLARVGHHVAVEGADALELLLVLAGHLVEEGAFHVDDLVVAEGQDEVLREGIHKGEGNVLVVELAEVGIQLHVVGDVVHPAHVPLEVEAQTTLQAALAHRLGDVGPGGGFLGDHETAGVEGEHMLVQLLEKVHRLQILVAAVDVGDPLAALAAVIQIEHGGHRVHPETVDVELLHPEVGGGEQEGAHLVAGIVKDHGAPVLVLALAGVGVLICRRAVELVETEAVLGEVGGYPVQNDAHARLVELVN